MINALQRHYPRKSNLEYNRSKLDGSGHGPNYRSQSRPGDSFIRELTEDA